MERLYKCCNCQQKFLYCADEDELFHLKTSAVEPKPCEGCFVIRRASKSAHDNSVRVRCEACENEILVPCHTRGQSSVFCTRCIEKRYLMTYALTEKRVAED